MNLRTPRSNGNLNVIVDISAYQPDVDFAAVHESGIKGIIARCTVGAYYSDPLYSSHLKTASEYGFYWGAYHFGTGEDLDMQLSNFKQHSKRTESTLLVLDWENNPVTSQGTMSLSQAKSFV